MPSFKTIGNFFIRIADVKKNSIKTTFGSVDFKIEKSLKFSGKFKGFLTVGFEKRGIIDWNRSFCVLDGKELKFWNYPQQEEGKTINCFFLFVLKQ